MVSELFFLNKNQIPIAPNIIRTEWNWKDCLIFKVSCSETESVNASDVVNNGLIALRYLCCVMFKGFKELSRIMNTDEIKIIENKKNNEFLIFNFSILLFWIKIQIIDIRVVPTIIKPPKPKIKLIPGLSRSRVTIVKEIEKNGRIFNIKFFSLCTKGKEMKNNPIKITKNWFPPHADNDKDRKIPDKEILIIEVLSNLELRAFNRRNNDSNPKNIPSGSDLNHPINPRTVIASDTEKNNDENNPAVVPPISRVTKNIIIEDKEPIITGKIIV